jgi:hypothetical protein
MVKAATLEVEIGAKIDKFERSLGKVRKDLKGMEKRLGGVSRGATKATGAFSGMAKKLIAVGIAYFGARGIFRMAKSFLDVATSVETYRLRLEAMLGSQQAATEAMNYFKEVAAKVPFTLEEVIEAGVKVQAFGADLKAWTPIMADLAAFMGVTLPEAAGALGRAFAGGVGAADIFRERGILQVIKDFAKMEKGIDDITKISIPEFRDVMYEAFAGAESKVAGTADKLATTWVGIVSMLQDKWFKFRDAVMKTKIFELMKEGLASFNESMDKFVKTGGLEEWAKNTAIAVIEAFKFILTAFETIALGFSSLKASLLKGTEEIIEALIKWSEFVLKINSVTKVLGGAFKKEQEDLIERIAFMKEVQAALNEEYDTQVDKIANLIDKYDPWIEKLEAAKTAIDETKTSMAELGKETKKLSVTTTDSALPAARNFTDLLKLAKPTMESYKFATEEAGKAQQAFSELAINEFQTMEATIKDFVAVILTVFERWAIGQIIPKIMAALPFPLNLLAVGGAIASIKAIFSGLKSLKEGGVVMQEGIYHLHPREMVLPIEKAPQIMREMGQTIPGGAGGRSMVVNPVINIYAQTLDQDTINRASDEIYIAVERAGRRRGNG